MLTSTLVLIVVLIITLCLFGTFASPPELRLRNDLLRDYNALERPVENSGDAVVVKLGVSFQQIIDLNEKEEKLEVNAWLKYQWTDVKLRWDPREYENVTDLRHPAGSVWQPDILLYNSVDSTFDSTFKSNVLGYNDGTISWIPPGIFKASCKIDIYWFPFDEQICYFKFGSWTHNGREVDLQPGDFDMSDFIENGEWVILKTWDVRNERFYECCPEPYPDIKFFIQYYAFNLIMPCMLIMLLIALGFTLSPYTCEKVGLQISVSLAICIFSTIMNEMTPSTSEAVPLLGIFFQSCTVVSTAATGFTVYVQAIHFRNPDTNHRMGFWMRFILLEWVPFLLMMKQPKRENNLKTIQQSWKERKNVADDVNTAFSYMDGNTRVVQILGEALRDNFQSVMFQLKVCKTTKKDHILQQRLKLLNRIYDHVKCQFQKLVSDDDLEERHVEYEWHFAAMVVDRLGLILFSFIIVITSSAILLRAPYLFA
ncbi:unnamed protein product [Anisakis simplex]|uniref:Acetylcholine receptor subunit alpha-type acr-16 n=1 Tax=Anisakis simplex TaxID=6269 RepID=A0A0M3K0N0_ANISI|nr:unnamed protein product [Anisakis simplex]